MIQHTEDDLGSHYFGDGEGLAVTRVLHNVEMVAVDYDSAGQVVGVEVLTNPLGGEYK